mmetsp:Transcript_35724/g.86219  ORF Transcript_35724/g.86219 Transcript_35724/m.86219 type:complete len:237 (+) Transcript_35724:1940-2650(+)
MPRPRSGKAQRAPGRPLGRLAPECGADSEAASTKSRDLSSNAMIPTNSKVREGTLSRNSAYLRPREDRWVDHHNAVSTLRGILLNSREANVVALPFQVSTHRGSRPSKWAVSSAVLPPGTCPDLDTRRPIRTWAAGRIPASRLLLCRVNGDNSSRGRWEGRAVGRHQCSKGRWDQGCSNNRDSRGCPRGTFLQTRWDSIHLVDKGSLRSSSNNRQDHRTPQTILVGTNEDVVIGSR